jgi:hypothetical protein
MHLGAGVPYTGVGAAIGHWHPASMVGEHMHLVAGVPYTGATGVPYTGDSGGQSGVGVPYSGVGGGSYPGMGVP